MEQGSTLPPSLINWLSGLAGGTAQVLAGHPFDTVKVRLQTSSEYKGAVDCLRRTIRTESALGLYKGVSSPLIGIGFCNAVLFGANGTLRDIFRNEPVDGHQLPLRKVALAGALSGIVMAFVNCPIELLKVRLQVQDGSRVKLYRNIFDCAVKTGRAEGLAGLYRGIVITLARDAPSFACYFLTYEASKRFLAAWDSKPESHLSAYQLMLCGGIAGFGAWAPCIPQDVLKNRIQSSPVPIGVGRAFELLVAESGMLKGLFRGLGPTLARAFPANAATFLAYETVHKALAGRDGIQS